MIDLHELELSSKQYGFLLGRLSWSQDNKLEDGGIITVDRRCDAASAVNFYPYSDEFKYEDCVNITPLIDSGFYRKLLKEIQKKEELIGFGYHTHTDVTEIGQFQHEKKMARDSFNPDHPGNLERIFHKSLFPKDYVGYEIREKIMRIGSLVIEETERYGKIIYGFVPSSIPLRSKDPDVTDLSIHNVRSLRVSVPKHGIEFGPQIGGCI